MAATTKRSPKPTTSSPTLSPFGRGRAGSGRLDSLGRCSISTAAPSPQKTRAASSPRSSPTARPRLSQPQRRSRGDHEGHRPRAAHDRATAVSARCGTGLPRGSARRARRAPRAARTGSSVPRQPAVTDNGRLVSEAARTFEEQTGAADEAATREGTRTAVLFHVDGDRGARRLS